MWLAVPLAVSSLSLRSRLRDCACTPILCSDTTTSSVSSCLLTVIESMVIVGLLKFLRTHLSGKLCALLSDERTDDKQRDYRPQVPFHSSAHSSYPPSPLKPPHLSVQQAAVRG